MLLRALLAAALLVEVVAFGSTMREYRLYERVAARDTPVSREEVVATHDRQRTIGKVTLAVSALAAVAWFVWQYRAYRNLRLVGSRRTSTSPGFSIVAWFIPILNLFLPYQIVKETLLRSRVANRVETVERERGPAIVVGWWLTFLAGTVLGRIVDAIYRNARSVDSLIAGARMSLVAGAIAIVGLLLAVSVVARIDHAQRAMLPASTRDRGAAIGR